MLKKTLIALCATSALLSAGAAMADKPGAGWITIEKAIEVAKPRPATLRSTPLKRMTMAIGKSKVASPMASCMRRASMALPVTCCVTRKTDALAGGRSGARLHLAAKMGDQVRHRVGVGQNGVNPFIRD